ncbi:MAG: hypothetical protein H7306_22550 [Bacteriovorax sp.]|nr:hypothetical protein [Rhizobacter sp.]
MSAAHDPGRRMAHLEPGDWWAYDVTGSAGREGREAAVRGVVRVSVEARMAGGRLRRAIVFAPQHRIVGVDGAAGAFPMPTGLFYFEQDPASLDVAITGDNMGPGGSDRFALVPQVFYPGRFGPDTAYDNVLDFSPLGRVANTLHTVGIETVHTPLGAWAAWKAPISSTSEQFGQVVGCDYWRPGVGAPLRFEMTATGPDGSRLSTVAVLRATNRTLG